MKNNQIIEELAKIEGFKFERKTINPNIQIWRDLNDHLISSDILPNYLTSHDSMQVLIDGLSDEQLERYDDELYDILETQYCPKIHKATPAQKAESVLKALGRWGEEA